jgi:hypothetical protein
MTEPAAHPVAHHRTAYRLAYHKAHPRWLVVAWLAEQVAGNQRAPGAAAAAHRGGELRALPHPRGCGKHGGSPPVRQAHEPGSHTDPRAPLAAPRGEDRAPGPGPHAQPEPMRLRAVAVVRLERTLAHEELQVHRVWSMRPTGLAAHMRNRALADSRTKERYAALAPPVKPDRPPNRSAATRWAPSATLCVCATSSRAGA